MFLQFEYISNLDVESWLYKIGIQSNTVIPNRPKIQVHKMYEDLIFYDMISRVMKLLIVSEMKLSVCLCFCVFYFHSTLGFIAHHFKQTLTLLTLHTHTQNKQKYVKKHTHMNIYIRKFWKEFNCIHCW